MSGQQHAPAALYPLERPGTHFTGGWAGPRTGLDGWKISSPLGFDPRPSIVFEPCFALCSLRIPQNVLYRRERKTLLTYMLPHLTVTWTVRHETTQSHLVPRLRINVSYTPHSTCLHAVHNILPEIFPRLLFRDEHFYRRFGQSICLTFKVQAVQILLGLLKRR